MSLTVDYITMPPKSQEVSQIQHGEQVKYDSAQQEYASQFQQQVENGTHQTIRRAKPENKEFKFEDKDRNGKRKKRNNKKGGANPQGKEEESTKKDPLTGGSMFDMKV